ncbi:hypothetical protein CONPUDRAFT_147838 [Coniophora puteana RWD-64-598 SS2]|uniref:F-box domain-containing protein n=1 Tax=Coniophora puteana (strain RWD-64-598) TaxID=741705 RepID=R7SDI5_CONPW|nr:uncharacterized protein CONPUDRAFT_147838 [Coniophora puteana RWD-64-598 SS2]EIW74218.1 hypothetical protein CONPUDRAFT_147838 [Coniophora puteana RWD-64-598 SS2]
MTLLALAGISTTSLDARLARENSTARENTKRMTSLSTSLWRLADKRRRAILLVPELLHNIILNLEDYGTTCLPRIALVCKAFREPALDALYWTVGFNKFFLCLGSDVVSYEKMGPDDHIFPRLLSLALNDIPPIINVDSFLCASSLQTITLNMGDISGDVVPVLQRISSSSPNVLYFRCISGDKLPDDALCSTIGRWPKTQELLMVPLYEKTIALLGDLPCLRRIWICIRPGERWIQDNIHWNLRSLQELRVYTFGDSSICAAALPLIFHTTQQTSSMKSLRYLDIHVIGGVVLPFSDAVTAIIRPPSQSVVAKTLESIEIFIQPNIESPFAPDWEDAVNLLAAFTNLKTFKLPPGCFQSGSGRLGASNHQLIRLLQSWPLVEAIDLRLKKPLDVHDLLDVLAVSPQLQRFNVNVSITMEDVTSLSTDKDTVFPNNAVTFLCLLWESLVDQRKSVLSHDVPVVAHLLLKIAPHLSSIGYDEDTHTEGIRELLSHITHPSWEEAISAVHNIRVEYERDMRINI